MAKNATKIEEKLLGGEDAQIFSLDTKSNNFSLSDFSLGDEKTAPLKVADTLEGSEAMAFLGLPQRPLNYLKRGDHRRIHRKFRPLFQDWEERVANDKTKSINPDVHFWKHIRIRVWNKENIERFEYENGVPVGIVGKELPGYPTGGIEPSQYLGDEYDGNAISTFLSETKNSERPSEYFVQLLRVELTEDMQNHA